MKITPGTHQMQLPLIEIVAHKTDKEKDDSINTFASHLLSISRILILTGSIWGEALSLTERP